MKLWYTCISQDSYIAINNNIDYAKFCKNFADKTLWWWNVQQLTHNRPVLYCFTTVFAEGMYVLTDDDLALTTDYMCML